MEDQIRFDSVGDFIDKHAVVSHKGLYGIIREDRSFLLEPKYDWIWNFKNGKAVIELQRRVGEVDVKGKIVWRNKKKLKR